MYSIVLNLLVGPLFLGISILFKAFPPKKINSTYGYRTKRSMRTQQTWDHANRIANNFMVLSGIVTCVCQLIFSLFLSPHQVILYAAIVMVVLLALMFLYVERALKEKFRDESADQR